MKAYNIIPIYCLIVILILYIISITIIITIEMKNLKEQVIATKNLVILNFNNIKKIKSINVQEFQKRNIKKPAEQSMKTCLKSIKVPSKILSTVKRYAKIYNLDQQIILSVIQVESKFKSLAISHKGAVGLMQVMYKTALEVAQNIDKHLYKKLLSNKKILLEIEYNIRIGAAHLNYLIKRYGLWKGVRLYNAGEGNIKTRIGAKYTNQVKNYYQNYSFH